MAPRTPPSFVGWGYVLSVLRASSGTLGSDFAIGGISEIGECRPGPAALPVGLPGKTGAGALDIRGAGSAGDYSTNPGMLPMVPKSAPPPRPSSTISQIT
jgi:hypothetical protein